MDTRAAFAEAARDACDGKIDGGELVKRTDRWVRRKARYFERMLGTVPAWLGREDLEQELRVQLVLHLSRFDGLRAKSASPEAYLSFSTRKRVQKIVQRAQGLEQHRRSGRARFEIAVGDTACPDGPTTFQVDAGADPHAEVDRAERYGVLRGLCDTEGELAVIGALEVSGGEEDAAADWLWADKRSAFRMRFASRACAVRAIRMTVARLLEDYGMEARHG